MGLCRRLRALSGALCCQQSLALVTEWVSTLQKGCRESTLRPLFIFRIHLAFRLVVFAGVFPVYFFAMPRCGLVALCFKIGFCRVVTRSNTLFAAAGWCGFCRGNKPLGMWAEVKVHSYHALTHVCVGSCMCEPRPCLSYSRRRDRINSVLLRSYYKGGGGTLVPTLIRYKCSAAT